MKFKKTSVIGVVLSLVLVLAVTAAFASEPKELDGVGMEQNEPVINAYVELGDISSHPQSDKINSAGVEPRESAINTYVELGDKSNYT